MKTTPDTIEIQTFACDHCGGKIQYSRQFCIVCGKDACDKCFTTKLICLRFETARYYGLREWAHEIPHCYACIGCHSALTKAVGKLRRLLDKWKRSHEKFKAAYSDQEKRLSGAVTKRLEELERD